MIRLCQRSGLWDNDPLVEQVPQPVGGWVGGPSSTRRGIVQEPSSLRVGAEEWTPEGIKIALRPVCLGWITMSHLTCSCPITMAATPGTAVALECCSCYPDNKSYLHKSLHQTLGVAQLEGTLDLCGDPASLAGSVSRSGGLRSGASSHQYGEPVPDGQQSAAISLTILVLAAASLPACLPARPPAHLVVHLLLLTECGHVSALEHLKADTK